MKNLGIHDVDRDHFFHRVQFQPFCLWHKDALISLPTDRTIYKKKTKNLGPNSNCRLLTIKVL